MSCIESIKLTEKSFIMFKIFKLKANFIRHFFQNALNLPSLTDFQILNSVTDLKSFSRLNKHRLPTPGIILDISSYLVFILHP